MHFALGVFGAVICFSAHQEYAHHFGTDHQGGAHDETIDHVKSHVIFNLDIGLFVIEEIHHEQRGADGVDTVNDALDNFGIIKEHQPTAKGWVIFGRLFVFLRHDYASAAMIV